MDIIARPSPNFDERNAGVALQYIVLHYTNMKTGEEAHRRVTDAASRVSAHYVIEEDGRVFGLVDETKRAWHAGASFWRGVTDLNSASVGIELINPGHHHGYRAFPIRQVNALRSLLKDIIARQGMDAGAALLGHSDVAVGRKEDPGELFPWEALAKDGLGFWPRPSAEDRRDADEGELQQLLRLVGYECPTSGASDRPTRAALLAFQRRFHPTNMTGTPELETIARLRATARYATSLPAGASCSAALPQPA